MPGRDLGRYVADAQAAVAASITLPAGYSFGMERSSFEYLETRLSSDLLSLVPLTLAVDLFACFFSNSPHDRDVDCFMHFHCPFALVGGIWLNCVVSLGFQTFRRELPGGSLPLCGRRGRERCSSC